MFNAPSFNLSDLFWASVDLLTGNWFYLALFVATCGYIATMLLYNLWRWLKSRAEEESRAAGSRCGLRGVQTRDRRGAEAHECGRLHQ